MAGPHLPAHLIDALKLLYHNRCQTWTPEPGCKNIGSNAETIDYLDKLEKMGLCIKTSGFSLSKCKVAYKINAKGSSLVNSVLRTENKDLSKDRIAFREAAHGASIMIDGLGSIACMPFSDGHYTVKMLDSDTNFISDVHIGRPEVEKLIAGLAFMLAQEHENHVVERKTTSLEEAAFGKESNY